jgi:hypothetical protein
MGKGRGRKGVQREGERKEGMMDGLKVSNRIFGNNEMLFLNLV